MTVRRTSAILLAAIPLLLGARDFDVRRFGAEPALPVWPIGRDGIMNDFIRFEAAFDWDGGKAPVLDLAALDLYRVRLNGEFVAFGPARAAKGYVRPDVLRLGNVRKGRNLLEIEVSAYGINTSSQARNAPFLSASVVSGGRVLARTGIDGDFRAYETGRLRRTVRFSCQRGFFESYLLPEKPSSPLPLSGVASAARRIPRHVPYPEYETVSAVPLAARTFRFDESGAVRTNRFVAGTWQTNEYYHVGTLDSNLFFDLQRFATTGRLPLPAGKGVTLLKEGEAVTYALANEESGFLRLDVTADGPATVVLAFDETLTDGRVDAGSRGFNVTGAAEWRLEEAGTYRLETFEPYSAKYLEVLVRRGRVSVGAPSVRTYQSPFGRDATCPADDPGLRRIYAASVRTWRQNAVDLFSDCPSRERAGYPCDAFFTGRAAELFDAKGVVEKSFFENYLLPERFDFLPEGMLPLCYPSDLSDGLYIPNWAMWLFVELEDYVAFTGDRAMAEAFRGKFEDLVRFFAKYEDGDGFLRDLPGWVFVEWSRANALVRGVNYPSNMVWAEALTRMGRLCGCGDWTERGRRLREAARARAFDGTWFRDSSDSDECTETCQYYAFAFGVATQESHPDLWRRVVDELGPDRVAKGLYPELHPSNAFIGNYLRLLVLSRAGLREQVLAEIKRYFLYMADETGTLWENVGKTASCNHGFASYAAYLIHKFGKETGGR